MPDYSDEPNLDWTARSNPNESYVVKITIKSKGRSSFAELEASYCKLDGPDDCALSSDIMRSKICNIDTLPFATLLQLDQIIEFMPIAAKHGLPLADYNPSRYPAAFVFAVEVMGHIQRIIDQSSDSKVG